ncbi:MAG: polysaccharide biosynthesis C-terminal domain-containing protein [bacterium]|nr:polysaccharide biosynthesis C-terminal domain-containing protein [bacterium]
MFQNIKNCIIRIQENSIVRDTLVTTFFATGGKAVGFLIPFFIAAWYGVGTDTDAFFFAYSLIIYLATIFAPVLESIIVPFIAEKKANDEDISVFVGRILGLSAIGLLAISGIFLVVIKPLLSVLTRFSSDGLTLIYELLLETIPLIVLLVWTSILSGALNAYKVFVIPAISPALRAVITLGFIFLFKESLGVHAIALGYVIGEVFRLGLLFLLIRQLQLFRIRIVFNWEPTFAKFLNIAGYQLVGMAIMAFTPIINKAMASWLGSGSVSILEYADRLYMIPVTFFTSGFTVTLLAHWSERYQNTSAKWLEQAVIQAVKIIGGIGLVLTLILYFGRGIFVSLVYGYGKFQPQLVNEVAQVFGIFVLSLTPYFLSQIYVRAILVRKQTQFLLYLSLFRTVATIVLNWFFMQRFGVTGIAASTTIVSACALGLLIFFLHFFSGNQENTQCRV